MTAAVLLMEDHLKDWVTYFMHEQGHPTPQLSLCSCPLQAAQGENRYFSMAELGSRVLVYLVTPR